ncbi:hypothetical protein MACJ_000026 [Theileria orientalis]|uniref:Rhoptry neck protein 2 n=1 Tax=Theileria orientalis TaxID=68886 RepID=A0A976M5K1_THEOR|nr:hypothetical protein MACJ_000026 [Theileria orientalis]
MSGKNKVFPNYLTKIIKILLIWVFVNPNLDKNLVGYGNGAYALGTIDKQDLKNVAKNIEMGAKKTANGLGMAKDVLMNMYEFSKSMNDTINNYHRNKFQIEDQLEKKYSGAKEEEKQENQEKEEKESTSDIIKKKVSTVNKMIKDKVLGDDSDTESETESESESSDSQSSDEGGYSSEKETKSSVVRKDPLAKDFDKLKAKLLRRKLYKYYTFGSENVKEENNKQLEQAIGYEQFLRPFIASLKPEFKALLRGQPVEYFRTYYTISQRLFSITNPILKSITNFDGSTVTSEVVSFDHELHTPVKPSYLQLFQNSNRSVQITTNQFPTRPVVRQKAQSVSNPGTNFALNGRDITEKERTEIKNEMEQTRVRLKSWEVDSNIQQATLLKTLYLLVSDVTTRDSLKRLENLANALGYNIVKKEKGKVPSGAPLANSLGADMFWVSGNNPFILGHLATMMLGYTEYDSFFSEHPRRRFYSWLDLVRSGPGGSVNRLDYMCGIRRGSRYSRGSNGLVTKKISTAKKYESNVSSDGVFLCEMLEVLLRSINLTMDSMGDLLNQKGATYEPNVGSVVNGKRMQAKLCSNPKEATISVRCDFEHSTLVRQETYRGVPEAEATDLRKRLSEAFDVFLMMGDINSVDEAPYSWFRILADPRRFRSFFEMSLMWDPRMFSGEKKGTWMADYNKYETRRVGRNLTAEVVPAYNAVEYYQKLPYELGIEDIKKKPKILRYRALHRLYIYMASSGIKKWIETNMSLMNETYNYSPSVLLGGSIANRFRDFYDSTSIGLAHVFLYNLLSKKFPAKEYLSELVKLSKADPFSRFVDATSIFAPAKMKKVVKWFLKGNFVKKFMQEKTKLTLKQLVRGDVLRDALESITFVTHSMANIQVIQNAEYWGKSFNDPENPTQYFKKGGVISLIDNTIKVWSDQGYTKTISEKLKSHVELNEDDLKIADFQHIHNTESIKWDKHLNTEILNAYNQFLEFPSIKMLESRGHMLYEVVKDSRDNLEQNIEQTIFFGRILGSREMKSKLKQYFRRAQNFGNFVLNRSIRNVDHAIWFGIKLDLDKVMRVVNELHKLQRKLSGNESWNLQGAFIDVIEDLVEVLTNQTSRIPVGVKDNYGMPTLSNMYGRMSLDERRIEFQQSMCSEHCGAIWKAIMAFTMSTLRNPGSIKSYEKNLSSTTSLSDLYSPNYVNNVRFILKGDAWNGFYETMLPKSMKKELEIMEYGKSFYIANTLKMASVLMNRMGFVYTATTMKVQAPYFGNFTAEWIKERKKNNTKVLFSALALGTMATYTVLECMDIAQHAVDMGHPPIETCWYLVKPPSVHCTVEPVSTLALSASSVAIRDVFSSTILALTGPYMMIPMGAYASWTLLKRQFKILHRLDMAMNSVFTRLWKRVNTKAMIKNIANLFRNRDQYRKEIEAAAVESKKTGNEEVKTEGGFADDGNTFSYTHME